MTSGAGVRGHFTSDSTEPPGLATCVDGTLSKKGGDGSSTRGREGWKGTPCRYRPLHGTRALVRCSVWDRVEKSRLLNGRVLVYLRRAAG